MAKTMNLKYKKMLAGMQRKKVRSGLGFRRGRAWLLYILKCNDGTFYTGVTNDLQRRFSMHSKGKAARYTRTRRPVALIYQEKCSDRAQALVRECAVKSFSRKKKEELVAGVL